MRSKTGIPRLNVRSKPTTEQVEDAGPQNNPAQLQPIDEPDGATDLDEIDPDDERWDVFIADDDERDPQPDYGDFCFPD